MDGKEYKARMAELSAQMAELSEEYYRAIYLEYDANPRQNVSALARKYGVSQGVLQKRLARRERRVWAMMAHDEWYVSEPLSEYEQRFGSM